MAGSKKHLAGGYSDQIKALRAQGAHRWYVFPELINNEYEHIPAIFTSMSVSNVLAAVEKKPDSYWLFFNEPDFRNGVSYLPIADAVKLYHDTRALIESKTNLAKFIVGGLFWPTGVQWFNSFRSVYQTAYGAMPSVDGWHVHAYADAAKYVANPSYWRNDLYALKRWVDATTPGAEVWITEFGCLGNSTVARRVMVEQVPWLEEQAWIQRYFWYTHYSDSKQGSLFVGDTSLVKTELGVIYTAFGSDPVPPGPPPFQPPAFVNGERIYRDPTITDRCPAVLEYGYDNVVVKRYECEISDHQDYPRAHDSTTDTTAITYFERAEE